MTTPLAERAARWSALTERSFDVLIIGGGITGCGIARAAALRGWSTALVEKNDFASGTSSRSSRLVHGGVRYLEHGHLRLVFESSAERRRLLRLAPHLVQPLEFTWPVYRGARVPRWKLGAGLALYDALALFRNVGRHRRLSRSEVLAREPSLAPKDLLGGATYYDARTNDARLTLANAIGAIESGAVVLNHVEAGLVEADGRRHRVTVTDTMSGSRGAARASVVVRAVGPWAGAVRGSKGAHIAVERERVGNRAALTLLSPTDGRVLFTLPAGDHAIIGTTDTYTDASPDDVRASKEDVRYLLDAANHFFPDAQLGDADVVSAWAGIRPLVPAHGDTPGGASREHLVSTEKNGEISITGGKLTTYRVMANDVLAEVAERLGKPRKDDPTANAPLPGGDIPSLSELRGDARRSIGSDVTADRLVSTYGSRWPTVWAEMSRPGGELLATDDAAYTIAELRYAVRHERALTIGDLLIRRTHLAFETRDHGESASECAARVLASELGWDDETRRRAIDAYAREAARVFSIDG